MEDEISRNGSQGTALFGGHKSWKQREESFRLKPAMKDSKENGISFIHWTLLLCFSMNWLIGVYFVFSLKSIVDLLKMGMQKCLLQILQTVGGKTRIWKLRFEFCNLCGFIFMESTGIQRNADVQKAPYHTGTYCNESKGLFEFFMFLNCEYTPQFVLHPHMGNILLE
ncbi:hypothetical protein TIFTF001_032679 [Ficus carica]|uniref:Uncharacterized protein n=1 Tax=Ficus carica TaxID=3494 RepID=A0AA88DX44_FICCA|nr:hypothetical protein TIFTF001_032679 [Ficus carica]